VTATVGDSIPVTVRVTDENGAGLSGVSVQFAVAEGNGAVRSSSSITDSNGDANNSWLLPNTPGTGRLVATLLQLAPVEFKVTVQPGAAAQLQIQTQPSNGRIGTPFNEAPVVEVRDKYGNLATTSGISITSSIGSGGGNVEGTAVVTATDGVARFTNLLIRGTIGTHTLRFAAPNLSGVESATFMVTPAPRATVDRLDDMSGAQIHVIYVTPSDGEDRLLDTQPDLVYSIASFQTWLAQKTGYKLRIDTYFGTPDITFARLNKTGDAIASLGPQVRDEIDRLLRAAGYLVPGKIYAVYYDGVSTYACGGASWPPLLQGQLAAMYLRGLPDYPIPCGRNAFVTAPTEFPKYWEFAMLHDLLHTLGIVSAQAPHHVANRPGHVPEPADLMYAGDGPWLYGPSMVVDVGGDDYFGPAVGSALANLATTQFSDRVTTAFLALSQLSEPSPESVRELRKVLSMLPFHPPFETLQPSR